MRDDGILSVRYETRIETALGNGQSPHGLSRLRLDCESRTISTAGNEQAHTIHVHNVHRRVARVIGASAGSAHVNDVPGTLIKCDEALCTSRLRTPGRGRGADDNERAVDDR